jgi:hypothetical protein
MMSGAPHMIRSVPLSSVLSSPIMNNLATKELYSSPNGDRWHLCRDASGYVFVLHQPNIPSGGRISRIDLSDFLARGGGPEQQSLLQMIGSLIPSDTRGHAVGTNKVPSAELVHGEDSHC